MEKNPAENMSVSESIRGIYSPNLLSGKVCLITGGSRGIGRAIAVAFGALGAKVIVNYSGNVEAAESTVAEIESSGGIATCVKFDVSNFTLVQEVLKNLEKEHGNIEILVNNAGVSYDNLFVKFKEDEWDKTLNTNLKGAFNCSRALAMSMLRKRSGKIINISSIIGLTGNPGQAAYSASKAGLIGLTKSLALELAGKNIQINAIAPGFISTDMTSNLSEDVRKNIAETIPMGRIAEAIEIAKMAVFLASSASSYITGQTIAVDGGMTMN